MFQSQRNLQMQIEEQGKQLKKMLDHQMIKNKTLIDNAKDTTQSNVYTPLRPFESIWNQNFPNLEVIEEFAGSISSQDFQLVK